MEPVIEITDLDADVGETGRFKASGKGLRVGGDEAFAAENRSFARHKR
ncbi:MAG: hypothetical protein JWN52_2520 [Actinomycetia bacterium]|nr:hypothetical protein [Actinomycetes bacterium]